jgi:hypothetical protein
MATYVNDLRLKEISTGDESGTWGTSTNTNLELIGEALGYATQQVFGSDADATTTIADGASDPARAMYFKITSAGSLTATRTCTIAPNTVSRVMFIENATSGSQSIAISQGSGASVTILTGKTAVVYLDGAGATAAVVDAMSGVDPGVTDTLTEVLVAGNTSGGTNIELSTTDKVQFRDADIYLNSSVDGQLDIVADTEIQIAATTVDLNGNLDVSGTALVTGVLTTTAATVFNGGFASNADSTLGTDKKVQFRDSAIYINSSADGQLDIVADTEIQIAATTIDVNGTLAFDSLKGTGATTVTNILDEDNMASDSATAIATQQSIKAYVDSQVGSFDTLAEVLAQGNTTGGTDLAVSTGDDITFADNAKAIFGAGSDLQIYHDGSASYIDDAGTGNLRIRANSSLSIQKYTGETMGVFTADGSVLLAHDNATKFETTSSGIDVTGTVTADGLTVDGDTQVNSASAAASGTRSIQFYRDSVERGAVRFDYSASAMELQADGSFFVSTGGEGTSLLIDGSTRDISFYNTAGSSQSLFWDASAESLGIGTSSPNRVLHVEGTASTFGDTRSVLQLSDDTAMAAGVGGGLIFTGKATTGQGDSNTTFAAIQGLKENGTSTNTAGAMLFSTRTSGFDPAERMRIDSSGNVGIGEDNPSGLLHLKGDTNSNGAELFLQVNNNNTADNLGAIHFGNNVDATLNTILGGTSGANNSSYLTFSTSNAGTLSEAMRIDASGNVGIGVVPKTGGSTWQHVQFGGTGNLIARKDDSTGDAMFSNNYYVNASNVDSYITTGAAARMFMNDNVISFDQAASGSTDAAISWSEAMRIDSNGNLMVGTPAADGDGLSIKPRASGGGTTTQLLFDRADTATTGFALVFHNNSSLVGSITYTNSATGFNTSSDQRLKENIADADDAGSKIDAIQVRKFDWKADGSHQDYGMVAQELIEVAPEAVSAPEDPEEMMGVDYSKLVPMMLKEIQSLRARIAALES